MKTRYYVLIIIVIIALWFMGSYNSLVSKNQNVSTSWAQVQTQYQRRFDLVPNLVAATKGVLNQEQKVFGDIATAREHYAGAPQGSDQQVQAAGQYDSAISRLLVITENYPQLQSVQSVQNLTDELAGTENRIAVARDRYNTTVQDYDNTVQSFPGNLFAHIFGYKYKTYYQSDTGASTAPAVNLNVNGNS